MAILEIIVGLLGGLCLFLYGMKAMGDGLEKVAGSRMQKIIESLTGNILKGVLIGALVTAIIQSSSATTVMVVGFVSAGIMTLKQAVGVIMGANIGTTVTAIILSINDLDGASGVLSLFKPGFLMYVLILIGVLMIYTMKKQSGKDAGGIFFGLGILFLGMDIMSSSMKGIDMSYFEMMFATFSKNPLLGVLVGMLVTALVQSSSASMGILLALSSTGAVLFGGAVPIILGQNIGTCITAILSSIGATKNAKKTALIHLLFNVIGALLFLFAIYGIKSIYPTLFPFWNLRMTNWNIAIFHLTFNVANTIVLLPFNKLLINLVNFIIKEDTEISEEEHIYKKLDDRFLYSPSIALNQCKSAMVDMFKISKANFELGTLAVLNGDEKAITIVQEKEKIIDKLEVLSSHYLVKIADRDVTELEGKTTSAFLHTVIDIERIGDYADNLCEYATELLSKGDSLSDSAKKELESMFTATKEIIEITIKTFEENNKDGFRQIQPYEEVIDLFTENLKSKHIERLSLKQCSAEVGIVFVEILNCIERIADHCTNIAICICQLNIKDENFDFHKYAKQLKSGEDEDYKEYFESFKQKYYNPII